MPAGGGNYAAGAHALGMCERCSIKTLLRTLTYDGQYPDMLVCKTCWDPKHPQEYLADVTDPETLYDPTGDPDKSVANLQVVSFPTLESIIAGDVMPLLLTVGVESSTYTIAGGGVTDA